jgi:hypothetical protein
MNYTFTFDALKDAPLIIDAIYEGGNENNLSGEPISKLLQNVGNMGGFRKTNRKDKSNLPAYVIIYTPMEELEWPDLLDVEIGVFRY